MRSQRVQSMHSLAGMPRLAHIVRDPLLPWSFSAYACSITSGSTSHFISCFALLAPALSSCSPGCSLVNLRLYADKTAKREIHLAPCDVTAHHAPEHGYQVFQLQRVPGATLSESEKLCTVWYQTNVLQNFLARLPAISLSGAGSVGDGMFALFAEERRFRTVSRFHLTKTFFVVRE